MSEGRGGVGGHSNFHSLLVIIDSALEGGGGGGQLLKINI